MVSSGTRRSFAAARCSRCQGRPAAWHTLSADPGCRVFATVWRHEAHLPQRVPRPRRRAGWRRGCRHHRTGRARPVPRPGRRARAPAGGRPHRRQRPRLHHRPGDAPRRGLRRQGRPLRRRRLDRRRPQPRDRPHPRHRRRRRHRHARLHRHPLPRQRRQRALQRQRQPAARPRAAGRPQGPRRQDAARPVGRGDDVRRHQARRRPHQALSRRGDARSPGRRQPPRRAHELVQLEGLRAGRHHQGHPRPGPRPLLPRRQRRAHRPRRRAGARRLR